MPTENVEVTVLVRNGQYTGLILEALLMKGFELVSRNSTHGGRELHLKPPKEVHAL